MDNNDAPLVMIVPLIAIGIFIGGMCFGSVINEKNLLIQGRNDGIVFCAEKAKQCKVEYDYLKLKENIK